MLWNVRKIREGFRKKPGKISHNPPFSLLIPDFEMVNSGTGREWKISIPKVWEREGNEKIHSQNSGTGREWKKTFPKFGNGKGMKKSIPKVRERESEASILGNDREREFPLTPAHFSPFSPTSYFQSFEPFQIKFNKWWWWLWCWWAACW